MLTADAQGRSNYAKPLYFELYVNYCPPGEERLFLGEGWGVRDVRGPYLMASSGTVLIDSWALSVKYPSKIELTFELSNRAHVEFSTIHIVGNFRTRVLRVYKNKASSITLAGMLADKENEGSIVISILQLGYQPAGVLGRVPGTIDIVAINSLCLTRE